MKDTIERVQLCIDAGIDPADSLTEQDIKDFQATVGYVNKEDVVWVISACRPYAGTWKDLSEAEKARKYVLVGDILRVFAKGK